MRRMTKLFFFCLFFGVSSANALAVTLEDGASPVSNRKSVAVEELMPGCSVGVVLPSNGAPWGGRAAAGLRCLTLNSVAVGVYAQLGIDKENKTSSQGVFLRTQYFFLSTGQALPYLFLQGMYGQNKIESSATTEAKSEDVSGVAGGGGVEVFVLPEISVAADVGVGGRIAPSKRTLVSSYTSQVAVYFHF